MHVESLFVNKNYRLQYSTRRTMKLWSKAHTESEIVESKRIGNLENWDAMYSLEKCDNLSVVFSYW